MTDFDATASQLEPIPEYGDKMTLVEFQDAVDHGLFIDYDGFGCYATDTAMSQIEVRPSDVKGHTDPRATGFTYVVWFNR